MFTEKDIPDLSTDFSERTQANVNIRFGMLRTKSIKSLLYWVLDSYGLSGYPTIVETNKVMFIEQLGTYLYKSYIIKKKNDQSKTKAKENSSGTLESEKKLKEWESKLMNYVSKLIGVNGVPLSYVVR